MKVYSPFTDNILCADLADMQLINKFNKGVCFHYVLLIFSVTTHGLFLWKIEKVLQLLMLFKNVLDESNYKPNKIWVEKGNEFYNKSIKSWLEKMP